MATLCFGILNSITPLLDNSLFFQWRTATWKDYLAACEDPTLELAKIFFYEGYLLIEMGNEGINHARFNSLLTMIFAFWFSSKGGQAFDDLGGCVIEKPNVGGGAIVLGTCFGVDPSLFDGGLGEKP